MRKIVVGTRKSKLAVIQTNWVIDQLKLAGVPHELVVKEFLTKGDQNLNVSLAKLGGSGVFIREMEQAMMDGLIDFAVHSLKDVPTVLPDELMITATPKREDPRDAYLAKDHIKLMDLPPGAVIGTSSARRAAQILKLRPDVKTEWIRGTVGSRIQQLHGDKYDAIILAVAGIKRLGLSEDIITEYLPIDAFVPAAGQGALAIECRKNDQMVRNVLEKINDKDTEKGVLAERAFVHMLDETDKAPIGCYAHVEDGEITLYASIVSKDGSKFLNEKVTGLDSQATAEQAANNMLKKGAREMVDSFLEEIKE